MAEVVPSEGLRSFLLGCLFDRHRVANVAAAALALAVNQAGTATTNTVVLMTPEEVDAAGKKSIDYTPPKA